MPLPDLLQRRRLRSLFFRLSDAGFFDFRLSSSILDQARRAIIADRPGIKRRDVNRLFEDIWRAFPEAHLMEVEVEATAAQLEKVPPTSRDYHVILAAVAGEVHSLVAVDKSHVHKETQDTCSELGISVLSYDQLLCACWKSNDIAVSQIFLEQMVEAGYTSLNDMFHHFVHPLKSYAPEFLERVVGRWAPPQLPNMNSILYTLGLEDYKSRSLIIRGKNDNDSST